MSTCFLCPTQLHLPPPPPPLIHHVSMRLSGHGLSRVLVEELVNIGLSKSVPNLQVMDEEGESGRLLSIFGEGLVLETQLKMGGGGEGRGGERGKGEGKEK